MRKINGRQCSNSQFSERKQRKMDRWMMWIKYSTNTASRSHRNQVYIKPKVKTNEKKNGRNESKFCEGQNKTKQNICWAIKTNNNNLAMDSEANGNYK